MLSDAFFKIRSLNSAVYCVLGCFLGVVFIVPSTLSISRILGGCSPVCALGLFTWGENKVLIKIKKYLI